MTVRPRRGRPTSPTGPTRDALARRATSRGDELYTRALGAPPSVRGEPLREFDGQIYRRWDPSRSKLAAALLKGWEEPVPGPGERWLYLGAGAGTTASAVADLVGPDGAVYAVEPSLRPFLTLLEVAERYPNLLPILGDARRPGSYEGSVPEVDGIYADVAQPDQPEIVATNVGRFLRRGGALLFVVKTASMGRGETPGRWVEAARARLPRGLALAPGLALDPFHRRHVLLGGRWDGDGTLPPPAERGARPTTRSRASRARGRP